MEFNFKNLFGIPAQEVKATCIVMPFIPSVMVQRLGLSKRISGKPYSCFQHEQFTVLETRMGPLFTGDAILMLKDTPCQKIIFVGSCGSLHKDRLPIGSLATPFKCYAMESFTRMLTTTSLEGCIQIENSGKTALPSKFLPVQCASVGSIQLEYDCQKLFRDKKIDIIEMECACVLAASNFIGRDAALLLYVTDIIGETSPYEITDTASQQQIRSAQMQISNFLIENF